MQNIRATKLHSPDYEGWSEDDSVKDFIERIGHYERVRPPQPISAPAPAPAAHHPRGRFSSRFCRDQSAELCWGAGRHGKVYEPLEDDNEAARTDWGHDNLSWVKMVDCGRQVVVNRIKVLSPLSLKQVFQ